MRCARAKVRGQIFGRFLKEDFDGQNIRCSRHVEVNVPKGRRYRVMAPRSRGSCLRSRIASDNERSESIGLRSFVLPTRCGAAPFSPEDDALRGDLMMARESGHAHAAGVKRCEHVCAVVKGPSAAFWRLPLEFLGCAG